MLLTSVENIDTSTYYYLDLVRILSESDHMPLDIVVWNKNIRTLLDEGINYLDILLIIVLTDPTAQE